MTSDRERSASEWCHLGPMLIYVVGGIFTCGVACFLAWIYPLVVMQSTGSRSPRVRAHAVASLNFHLSFLIWNLCFALLMFFVGVATFGIGWVLAIPIGIAFYAFALVVGISASGRVKTGQVYRYPLTIHMVH